MEFVIIKKINQTSIYSKKVYFANTNKILVIEDLISTGGSSLKAVDALRDFGCNVLGMAAIFTYGFDVAKDNFRPLINCSFSALIIKLEGLVMELLSHVLKS